MTTAGPADDGSSSGDDGPSGPPTLVRIGDTFAIPTLAASQPKRFVDAATLFPKAPRSLAATSGALIGADYHFDLIRPGVGLYGSGALDADNPRLAAAAIVEAPILQVRDVEPGEHFGYGATRAAEKKMRTATVALGYADGYLRSLGGRGYGVLGGAKRPILGRISMDLMAVDVTEFPEGTVRRGEMVTLIGPGLPIEEVATQAGTIGYEILTDLGRRFHRAWKS